MTIQHPIYIYIYVLVGIDLLTCTLFHIPYCIGICILWAVCTKIYRGLTQSLRNSSSLLDMTSKIWADFAKDWHKIGILQ